MDKNLIFKNYAIDKKNEIFNLKDERSKHLYLRPDYLFKSDNVKKIQNLKEVFLEFDEDNSSKNKINLI